MSDTQYGNSVKKSWSGMNFNIRVIGVKQPQEHWINYKRLALVCEGGGQRGIFTAGILDSFMKYDFFPFHTLIGVSAGAHNLSAYACGAYGYSRHAILRYTTQKAFFDPLRFARGGHLIDLDWYLDSLHQEAPLDIEQGRCRLKGRSLWICASRRGTLTADYLPFQRDSLREVIKASSAIPLLYRGHARLDGIDYWDGAVADALPVQAAHSRGGDCIVLIRTLPPETDSNLVEIPRSLKRGRLRGAVTLVESHLNSYRKARAFIEQPPDGVTIIEIAPTKPLQSRLLDSKTDALLHDYQMGQHCGLSFLQHYAW
jgi:predicted patatin/cPLA2 family phospholipase